MKQKEERLSMRKANRIFAKAERRGEPGRIIKIRHLLPDGWQSYCDHRLRRAILNFGGSAEEAIKAARSIKDYRIRSSTLQEITKKHGSKKAAEQIVCPIHRQRALAWLHNHGLATT